MAHLSLLDPPNVTTGRDVPDQHFSIPTTINSCYIVKRFHSQINVGNSGFNQVKQFSLLWNFSAFNV